MRLNDLPEGHEAYVVKILGHGAFRKRLTEMGFVRGKLIRKILSAPMKDPVKYSILGYEVSLRRSEAEMVEVVDASEIEIPRTFDNQTLTYPNEADELLPDSSNHAAREINIALIGNPNCGKTSMFNSLSGATEHVGNYSGVTVEAKKGSFDYGGYHFNVVDLPGTYSLAAYSPEELYVRRYLASETPDVIVNVVVASNLERNLYLTTELIDMDRSMVVALNMFDELQESGARLDYDLLGAMTGVPMVPTVSKTGRGLHDLLDTIIRVYEGREEKVRHVHIMLSNDLQNSLDPIKKLIKADTSIPPKFASRYLAIKFLEGDSEIETLFADKPYYNEMKELRESARRLIEERTEQDISSALAAEKYGFIDGALAETMSGERRSSTRSTSIIDAFVINRLFGIPLFLGIMFLIFWLTFTIGQYPMDWIENGVAMLSEFVGDIMPGGPLKDLITDGIIGGVGSVIVFLPNILILYACISFMEDSGYMARAAFIMDRSMHHIGLHGKSFIPLLMGFGCNVPAIMATRAIESRSSRMITILINPFMSCSARLPIYVLLIGTFFSTHAALVFFGIYALGVMAAMLTARLLRRFVWKTDETPFVMELPPYRVPTFNAIMRHTWAKGEQYLKKMGGIILIACIIVWALNYFPLQGDSYLEMLGKALSPVMKPIGIGWRETVAAIAGVPAKEIIVSTLGVLYTGNEAVTDITLGARLGSTFTPASALSFLVFVLLYCPCVATLAAIARETRSWKWAAFSAVYNTVLAWILAFIVYRLAMLVF